MRQKALRYQIVPAVIAMWAVAACAKPGGQEQQAAPEPSPATSPENGSNSDSVGLTSAPPPPPPDRTVVREGPRDPAIQPRVAWMAGLMPRSSIGADQFLTSHPEADGRGVIVGVLDSGIDAGIPGFQVTTTGERKILELRDFSGEGHIPLSAITPSAEGTFTVEGMVLTGAATVSAHAQPPYYAGVFHELPLGDPDVNRNGRLDDVFPIVVAKTSSGWAVFTDTDSDGLLEDEVPIHDFLVAQELFTYHEKDDDDPLKGDMTIAVNFADSGTGPPRLDLFFDNSSHGTHVSGIAAGHQMFGEDDFDGIAPGAHLVVGKISNNVRGGITVTGSMLRAMNYVADFAQQRGMPLVMNMSFGVGNETEGGAAIDSIVNEFALKHPDVLFVISAGNEGPGISTVGFPGSAEHIMSVCALFPGVFSGPRPRGFAADADGIADFSSRGGELAKPDLCAPGIAFSNMPPWNTGDEVQGGTSMAAPQIAGAAALLQSAMTQKGRPARASDLRQSLLSSTVPARGGTTVDMGTGVPQIAQAYEWLVAAHQAGMYSIRALADGANTSDQNAAYRRSGLESRGDTIQRFQITSVVGQPAARFLLRADQRWLRTPASVEMSGGPAEVTLTYDGRRLRTPGLYVGSVWATPASDTLAGPAFRMMNTVIVPQSVTQPFVEGRDVGPGRLRRYFFEVTEEMGGLTVEIELRYDTQQGTMYLFEPNGQAYRGGGSESIGGRAGDKTRVTVPADDVVPGVYEVVVVAPPTSALSFELRAARPRYVVADIGNGPTAIVGMREDAPSFLQDASVFQRTGDYPVVADSVEVKAAVIGASKNTQITGRGDTPIEIPVEIPDWANELVVDVSLSPEIWNQMTDLGVTVFDSQGHVVSLGPLSYAFGRMTVEIEPYLRGSTVQLEVFPAFAHLTPPTEWSADLRIALLAARPQELDMVDVDTTQVLTMDPGQSMVLQFGSLPTDRPVPTGFDPMIEVIANPAAGAPARLRRTLSTPR